MKKLMYIILKMSIYMMGEESTEKKLNSIRKQIQSCAYLKEIEKIREWGGADVVISSVLTDDIKKWSENQQFVISAQDIPPLKRAVITPYSKELSWLFYQLRDAFSGQIDYISKYDFYGSLAQKANETVFKHREDLLLSVLDEAIKWNTKVPENIELPFFAYGIFKPDQLGYFQVKEFVQECIPFKMRGELFERDGIPLFESEGDDHIHGFVLTFKERQNKAAYQKIAEMEPFDQYRWGIVDIGNNKTANVLLGKRVRKGSSRYDGRSWDGSKDPLFHEAIGMIDSILQSKGVSSHKIRDIFSLQMGYILLWSAIERYATLKYGLKLNPTEKIKKVFEETAFIDGLNKHVEESEKRELYRADDPDTKYILSRDNPKQSGLYYYQVRNNAVHRGKTIVYDYNIIRKSLMELHAIFKEMLEESFQKSKYLK